MFIYVCVSSACLYVLQALGCSSEGMNGQICLKFGTYSLGESLGVFLSFFENFDFWALGTWSWTLNGPKTFGVL